jgi:hypothetical protein
MGQFDALTLPQRVVLLGVSNLSAEGETPAQANEIVRTCRDLVDAIEEIGALTEAEVGRALNELEAEGFLAVPSMTDTSPTGKGRPAYEIDGDVDSIRERLRADDRLTDHVAVEN